MNFASRLRHIKSRFSRRLPKTEWLSKTRVERAERGIWQRRFWQHNIRDERDFRNHVAYCYFNPVKHGLVQNMRDWPHLAFHRDVRAGRFPADFNPEDFSADDEFGEMP